MPGLAFALPIYTDDIDGFKLKKTYLGIAQQNLKCLLLTNPGEKIMYPTFGVGVKHILFESMTAKVYEHLRSRIKKQTRKWLPYIKILDIRIYEPGPDPTRVKIITNQNQIGIGISFDVAPIGQASQVELYFNL